MVLKVIEIVIRKDVNGIGAIIWVEIVSVERKGKEKKTKRINNNHQLKQNRKRKEKQPQKH